MPTLRVAEYPRPDHVLLHLSDTHLIAGEERLYGAVDADARLQRLLDRIEAARIIPSALVFTGDLVDTGEPAAYRKLRAMVEPFAARLGCEVVWVMGNHDDRGAMRQHLLGEPASAGPLDRVFLVNGLRIVALDTSVPGHHHGEVTDAQLAWLARVLDVPAPFGTILAMHHPPLPTVADLAVTVELVEQHRLAERARGHRRACHPGRSPALLVVRHLRRHPGLGGLVDLLHPGPGVRAGRHPRPVTPRRRSVWCTSTRRR